MKICFNCGVVFRAVIVETAIYRVSCHYVRRGTAMLSGVNLSSNAYPTGVLPPLVPPIYWGEKEMQFPPLYKGRVRVG
jgi:hypothetical protein